MKTTEYAGLDYGFGQANVSKETGIRYGVIAQNSLNQEALDEIYYGSDSKDLYFENYKTAVLDSLQRELEDALAEPIANTNYWRDLVSDAVRKALKDYFQNRSTERVVEAALEAIYTDPIVKDIIKAAQDAAEIELGDNYQFDESHPYFNDGSYEVERCLDFDLVVTKSPFFTYSQYCSPCVMGAGNLDTFCATGPKTYCFGHDWFDDNKAPYPVYRVDTGELVEPCTT